MSDSTDAPESPLFDAFWKLVAQEGWHRLTLSALAAEAGMTLAELREHVPHKGALPLRFMKAVDAAVLRNVPSTPMGSARDRLFDVLMSRIDALQPHRAGVIRMGKEMRTDPALALMLAPQLAASMSWMLEAAGIDAGGIRGMLRVQGLCGVWIATLRAWEQDEGADLGSTMAGLDRALDRAERVAHTLRLDSKEAEPAHGAG
ncbi:TetR family transcriptional regulator [Pseudoroseomonas wenyumeiae]|uniref:TetR family transcriptional regulator n=1 Tax=Teichococcus wenyumeiae TaxID=2478470 RepID=A0A3A9JL31_9PROT|nr:TetR family transcriptional regulator [Pseudoroseomonas wenyumeiae]RKK05901.1 TetR family transcriptional regulator [Pseudoroseomonas wenyumeiae]RMI25870.1 TetR family transcriptional regulator [Pseudoroseomonas wenyumeiae]